MSDAGLLHGERLIDGSVQDDKLATISTPGKVSNAATTATSAGTVSAIVARDGSGDFTARKVTLSGTPSSTTDAATVGYVQDYLNGFDWKAAVNLATIAALPANTRSGNVLTVTATGTLTIDSVLTTLGMRILVKNEATGANNGIFDVTTAGAVGVQAVLTRCADADSNADVTSGMSTLVLAGTTLASTAWTLGTADPITLNTTSLTFNQTGGPGSTIAGAGMTQSGSTLNVIAADTSITVNADSIQVGATSLTNAHINASAAIDWSKISKTSSSLADLATRSAADLSSGTLLDARLSSNVMLRDTAQTSTALKKFQAAAAGTQVIGGLVTADGTDRYAVYADGKMEWGSGSATRDVTLYRSAADVLKTDDALVVGGTITAGSGVTVLTNSAGQILNAATTGTAVNTASTLVLRDAAARFQAADPSANQDVATKVYVDTRVLGIPVKNEVPTGTINGTNPTFTLAYTPVAGTLNLRVNGVQLKPTTHYTLATATITFVSPYQPLTGEWLYADYIR